MDGYRCLHEFAGGAYDCDYVSPWSKSAHNVESEILIVGQDWASETELCGPINFDRVKLGYDPNIPTNRNLDALLLRHFGMHRADLSATNAFPFIKPGRMQGDGIPLPHMRQAVREFLIPQVRIIEPKIVICLGLSVFNAVRKECGYSSTRNLDFATKSCFDCYGSTIFAVAHTGSRGTNARGRGQVDQGWASIRERFDKQIKS